MNKIYVFGAGNNAYGVISYIGSENVIAIIDNEEKKQGDNLMGIPIISLDEYIANNNGEQIVISAAIYNEIVNQLEENNVYNYSIAPMLVRGMATPTDIYRECELEQDKEIVIYGRNIVVDKFIDYIEQNYKELELKIIANYKDVLCCSDDFDKKTVVFKEDIDEEDRKFLSNFRFKYDAYDIMTNSRKEKIKKLSQYKNKYKNKKCVIVCNGPSLQMSDLEKLYDENICTFGCNLIFNIYSDTYWRPDFYVISEFGIYKTYYNEISKLRKVNKDMFVKGICETEFIKELDGVNYYYEDCRRKYYGNAIFSDDITKGVYSGYTVAYDMIQIAAYIGFTEIYLIGADFSYNGDAAQKGNHVYDSKFKDKRKTAGMTYIDCSINSMKVAKRYADSNGIKIYNATRGGKLEVFERKSFDEVLEKIDNNK